MKNNNLINIVTLGCSKNLVDSEHLSAQFKANGYDVVFDSNSTKAKIVIINTCGFIGDAKEESVNTILNFAQAKTNGHIERLFVFGCLSERYKDELRVEIPEVDSYFGAKNLADIVEILKAEYFPQLECERVISTPKHYAFLKISEGCNRGCGYCAIPLIRGKYVSVPIESLVKEAEGLASKGVKELIVIAQDTTYYGQDLYGEKKLAELLRLLCRVDGIEWVRLHYAYPADFPDDVIGVMRDEPKMCKYIDIPLQHISDSQLKSMRRGIGKEDSLKLIDKLRNNIPNIAIRTTMLVGYPGESEADFEELKEFVESAKFDRLGVFAYSEEEGTYSAEKLVDDVPDDVKHKRVDTIMAIQSVIAKENNLKYLNRELKVIIDRKEGDLYIGRSEYDSPDVDNEVIISSNKRLFKGNFYKIRVVDVEEYDIYGELVS